ncbi:hypothetical protein CR513_61488, partial [Mucuna pruriens]
MVDIRRQPELVKQQDGKITILTIHVDDMNLQVKIRILHYLRFVNIVILTGALKEKDDNQQLGISHLLEKLNIRLWSKDYKS